MSLPEPISTQLVLPEEDPGAPESNRSGLRSALKNTSHSIADFSRTRPRFPSGGGAHELGVPDSALSPPIERPRLNRAQSSNELLPPGYQRRVGFSTLETEEPTKGGGTGAEYSFTLQAKSSNYTPGRDSRCFLVATDGEEYSIQALDWLVGSLVEVCMSPCVIPRIGLTLKPADQVLK